MDLRRNNFTWIDLKTISDYENLKVIDLRQNPLVCGKIELSKVEIKSDCHSTATVKSKKYHNTPIPKSSEVPKPSSPDRSIHSPAIPFNVSTTLRFHLYTTRSLQQVQISYYTRLIVLLFPHLKHTAEPKKERCLSQCLSYHY